MVKFYYVLKGETVTLNCDDYHIVFLLLTLMGSFLLVCFALSLFLIISLMYAIRLTKFCHDEQRSHTITVFCIVTGLVVISKLLCSTSSSLSTISSFEKTLCNGSNRNFDLFRKLFGFAISSDFKGCIQYSETLSAPLIKCQSLIFELVLISFIQCII